MTLDITNNPALDPKGTTGKKIAPGESTHESGQESGKKFPGEHDDSSTVKNPKTPETSGKTEADRVANRAAHKPARDQQDAEKPIFTH